jgi:hypothetical protein
MEGSFLVPEIESRFRQENGKLTTSYYRYSQAYLAHAKAYILAHRGHFSKNYLLKLWNQFTVPPTEATNSVPLLRTPQTWRWLHHLLLLFGLAGLVLILVKTRDRHALLLTTLFAYFVLFGALFHLTRDGRMTLALKVFLILYASIFVDWALSALRRKDDLIAATTASD